MLRVVSGKYRGRKLEQPPKEITRATKDMAKEGLFNSLGNIVNKSFLDCFGGSGAIGIEAYSRGAKDVYIIEQNREALDTIKLNLKAFNIGDIKLITGDFFSAYKSLNKTFDIIFLDPPYKYEINLDLIDDLYKYKVINEKSLIVIERENELDASLFTEFNIKRLKYGKTLMFILSR